MQTHDRTTFATERVIGGGILHAAAIVGIDGATGELRFRSPITTSSHNETPNLDCMSGYPDEVRDGIGLTDKWALTTADAYAVVVIEQERYLDWVGSSPDAYCGPGAHGYDRSAQYLSTVERDGATTLTQLSTSSDTYPSTSSNVSTPAVRSLAADARGNHVVTLGNDESQLFGPAPGVAILPLGADTIVSDTGVHVSTMSMELE